MGMYIFFCYISKNKNVILFSDVHLTAPLYSRSNSRFKGAAFSSCLGSLSCEAHTKMKTVY